MMDETKGQPTAMVIKTACLLFAGPLLMHRAFKQSGPHGLPGIANFEFSVARNDLQEFGLGKVRSVRVRFSSNLVTVLVKEDPDKVPWPTDYCNQTEYCSCYNQEYFHLERTRNTKALTF